MTEYGPAELAFLKEGYKHMQLDNLTVAFNEYFKTQKGSSQIRAALKNHKIRSGRTGCFEKGCVSWNHGIKGSIKPNSGSFKKGIIPANTKPLGHERICSKDGYVLIKVAEPNPYTNAKTRYKHKHIVVWEQLNGPVPKGMVVTFADGNKFNFDPQNLRLIDRNLLCRYNQNRVYDLPSEVIPTMKTLVELKQKMFTKNNQFKDKEPM